MRKFWKRVIAAAAVTALITTNAGLVTAIADTTIRSGTVANDVDIEYPEGQFTITIDTDNTNTAVDHVYEAYQIFKGDLLIDFDYDGDTTSQYPSGASTSPQKTLSNVQWGDGLDSTKLADLVDYLQANIPAFANVSDYTADNDTSAEEIAKILGEVTVFDAELTQQFADIVGQYLDSPQGTSVKNGDKYEITDLDAGYYLVTDKTAPAPSGSLYTKDDTYTRFILNLVADVEVTPKAAYPASEKKVKENVKPVSGTTDTRIPDYTITEQFNDVADYNTYEPIAFELIGTVPSNYDDYESYAYMFSDKMCEGLTFLNDGDYALKVEYKNEDDDNWTTIPADNYSVLTEAPTANASDVLPYATAFDAIESPDHGFVVAFPVVIDSTKDKLDDEYYTKKGLKDITDIEAGAIIRVTFYAQLNDKAVIGLDGNPNESQLYYSSNPNLGGEGEIGKTTVDKVIVFTYELDTTKVDGTRTEVKNSDADYNALMMEIGRVGGNPTTVTVDGTKYVLENDKWYRIDGTKLPEAEFVLYRLSGTTPEYVTLSGTTVTGWAGVKASGTTLVTDEDGFFKVVGLDDGTYYLEETKAPRGFNLLKQAIQLVIKANTINGQTWTSFEATDALKASGSTPALAIEVGGVTADGNASSGTVATTVENNRGAILPSTGGIGTTIFYVLGSILVIGGGVLLVTKKRMQA